MPQPANSIRKWIPNASLVVDEETGAIYVKLLGEIIADIVQVDMQALTGDPAKLLKDVHEAVAALRASATLDTLKASIDALIAARDLKVNAAWRLAVTTTSGKIADRGGAALNASARQLMFIPHGAQTEYAHFKLTGTATTNDPQIAQGVAVPIDKTTGDTMELIATSGTVYVTCIELMPRS
ncbi:MAG TPA: hypothetical protein VM243_00770 [Phycisphaerae bacterium]|nr:hypothetical protein [Phycisphaerae bacterium]